MIDKEQFFKDFAAYAGIPDDVTITNIDQDASYYEGCPTCGGSYEFEVEVSGTKSDGSFFYRSVSGKLSDFINSL